ncbi:hypothetical protein OROHE_024697 [Orobanche hederae]
METLPVQFYVMADGPDRAHCQLMEIGQGIVCHTMLQWMGGSRRKVTTFISQKQYFEQRKQQQQHTTGLKSYDDGRRSCIGNNRSLDILSLVNVSTVAPERKISCINGDKSEEYDITLNHQYVLPCQAILDDEALHMDQTEIIEERTSSSYGTKAEFSEK